MDASDFAIGGYLFQLDENGSERVIAYGGHKMTAAELMYPTREKELLAALYAMELWKVYLIDKPFHVSTDHRTLESILTQRTCSQRLARRLNTLCLYRPLFRWIPGDSNTVADAISRNPSWQPPSGASTISLQDLLLKLVTTPEPDADAAFVLYQAARPSLKDQCKALYADDKYFAAILTTARTSENVVSKGSARFVVHEDLIYFSSTTMHPREVTPASIALCCQ
ncbi:TPA: hypothetical protein N0F65_001377 [Lagenidium giganteum]|uniref:Reverse transcriptase RNase H-like domain-containing protein n=1 Tax=Lagenidium giganteum TaxID=4803 RepID=A0AAV2YZZ9_9STRA|nr:TPA: hypothetical protein N0F65_001377 [Lagenidium giganteum]